MSTDKGRLQSLSEVGIGWVVRYATDDLTEHSAHFLDALYQAEDRGSLFAALRYAGAPSLAGRGMLWLRVERY